ncbi:MAG: hypothetical protein AABW71_00485 [Nanoarchaeota archaeon]
MKDNQFHKAVEARKAVSDLYRALEHLSSDGFLALPSEEQRAHIAAYRGELPELKRRIPDTIQRGTELHLFELILQIYE